MTPTKISLSSNYVTDIVHLYYNTFFQFCAKKHKKFCDFVNEPVQTERNSGVCDRGEILGNCHFWAAKAGATNPGAWEMALPNFAIYKTALPNFALQFLFQPSVKILLDVAPVPIRVKPASSKLIKLEVWQPAIHLLGRSRGVFLYLGEHFVLAHTAVKLGA